GMLDGGPWSFSQPDQTTLPTAGPGVTHVVGGLFIEPAAPPHQALVFPRPALSPSHHPTHTRRGGKNKREISGVRFSIYKQVTPDGVYRSAAPHRIYSRAGAHPFLARPAASPPPSST